MSEKTTVDPGTEANGSDLKKRREKIVAYVLKVMSILDPSGDNTKRWEAYFKTLDMNGFARFMDLLGKKEYQMNIVMPNMKKNLRISDLLKAAEAVNLRTSHRLWMFDRISGRKYLTNEKYLVLTLPIRRAQQEWDKKLMVPHRDKATDALTGQVMGDDAKCALSAPEIRSLNMRGLNNVLTELVKVRGGDVQAYGDFKRQMQENGQAELSKLDPKTRTRSAVIAKILLQGMMIDSNL